MNERKEQYSVGAIAGAAVAFFVLPVIFVIGMVFNWGAWVFAALIPLLIVIMITTPFLQVLLTIVKGIAWILIFLMAVITGQK